MSGGVEIGMSVGVAGERGLVRYVGPARTISGNDSDRFVGVELENPKGDCNGTKGGVEYFRCDPMYGVMVPISHVSVLTVEDSDDSDDSDVEGGEMGPASDTVTSTGGLSSVGQKLLARRRFMKDRNSKVWNKLDNLNEQMAIKCSLQMQSLFAGSDQDGQNVIERDGVPDLPSDYDGPILKNPLDLQSVVGLLEAFKSGKVLHLRYVAQILWAVRDLLIKELTIQSFNIAEGRTLTVVGDLHGQLQDLFSIFTINGLPSESKGYLFNGDFVDRGNCGVEVFLSICAWKLLYPDNILLNRGNHETRQQNRLMGFEEEVLKKYSGRDGKRLLGLFQMVFDALPLGTVVQEKIFVLHGGLFNQSGVHLEHLKGINRKREPPMRGTSFEDQIFESMLWSDPRAIHGCKPSSRGAGVEFGQDVTHDFLRENKLALIIRSHECVQDGFQLVHSGRLITLFSASRYCGLQTNKGAFLTVGPDLQPEIQQYYAHSMDSNNWEVPKEQEKLLEQDTIQKIVECILDAKHSLYWHFNRTDLDRTGRVSCAKWAEGLRLVLQMDLPFLSYLEHLAEVEEDGNINYSKFLERYRVEMKSSLDGGGLANNWKDEVISSIWTKMSAALGVGDHEGMRKAFDKFDKDGNGTIEYSEFLSTLKQLDIGLSDNQIYELMTSLDRDSDSVIDFAEFSDRFAAFVQVEEDAVVGGGADGNKEGEGYHRNEGEKDLQQEEEGDEDSHCIGGQQQERRRSATGGWQASVIQSISSFIFQNRHQLGSTFRFFDKNNDGVISLDEFRDGMNALNSSISQSLTDEQIRIIMNALDSDGDGRLSYNEFLNGFKITDTKKVDEELRRRSVRTFEKTVQDAGIILPLKPAAVPERGDQEDQVCVAADIAVAPVKKTASAPAPVEGS